MLANFGGVSIASFLWFLIEDSDTAIWVGFVGGGLFYAILGAVSLIMTKNINALLMGNVVALKNEMEPTVGYVPYFWCFLIRHFIPQILIVLFANLARAENDAGKKVFFNYAGYPEKPFQVLGVVIVVSVVALFLLGVIFPKLYEPFSIYEKSGVRAQKSGEIEMKNEAEIIPQEQAVEA